MTDQYKKLKQSYKKCHVSYFYVIVEVIQAIL